MKQLSMRLTGNRPARYLATGCAAALTEYLVFMVLYYLLGIDVVVANVISFLASLITGFTLHKLWVFGDVAVKRKTVSQAIIYGAIAAINICISSISIYFFTRLGAPAFVVKLVLIFLVAGWNYLLFRRLVFKAE